MQPPAPSRTAPTLSRRRWLTTTLTLLGAGTVAALAPSLARAAGPVPTPVEVWKDPNCGCCKDWVDHMQANGFKVTVHETGNNAVRARLGLPQSWARATPPWSAATWWKAMCPPAMCVPCCSKAQRPWALPCPACP